MADDTPGSAQVEPDDETKRLALEAAKAKYRKEIAEAQTNILATAVPKIENAPTGTTTLADKAGTYGPWLAHQALEAAAAVIAKGAEEKLPPTSIDTLVKEAVANLSTASTTIVKESAKKFSKDPKAIANEASEKLCGKAKLLVLEVAEKLSAEAGSIADAAVTNLSTATTTIVTDVAEKLSTDPAAIATTAGEQLATLINAFMTETAEKLFAAAAGPTGGHAVLVVERRDLIDGETTYHQVKATLTELRDRLQQLNEALTAAPSPMASLIPELEVPAGRSDGGYELKPASPTEADSGLGTAQGTGVWGFSGLGALPAAVGLLQLISTDYTVAGIPVSSNTSELATLVAASLSGRGRPVFVDDFLSVAEGSPTLRLWEQVVNARNQVVVTLLAFARDCAAVEASVEVQAKRTAAIEESWKVLVTMEKDKADAGGIDKLRGELTRETQNLIALKSASAAAKSLILEAVSQLTAVDAIRAELTKPAGSAVSPIRTALARERLHGENAISHVLYVELNQNGADSQTRRLVLGESGRLGFMGSANASWLLLRVEDASIVAGGHVSKANRMVYDLASGKSSIATVGEEQVDFESAFPDPALNYERWAKAFVSVVALFLIVVSVLAVLNVVID